jgi:autophagy-related protein 16
MTDVLSFSFVYRQTLVSGHLDHTLRLWDVKSGNGIKDLNGVHTDQITSVCVSPGGSNVPVVDTNTNGFSNGHRWILGADQ